MVLLIGCLDCEWIFEKDQKVLMLNEKEKERGGRKKVLMLKRGRRKGGSLVYILTEMGWDVKGKMNEKDTERGMRM